MKDGLKVAVVGATGAVGRELLVILEKRGFPIGELRLFASSRSDGKLIRWKEKSVRCSRLQKGCFQGIQIAFFDASDAVSLEWVPQAAEEGAWVVDNSSTYRLKDEISLIVPEINGDSLETHLRSKALSDFAPMERVVAGPNCAAAPLAMALKPLRDHWGIKRVVVSTYQSVSGAGSAAMEELSTQTVAMFNQNPCVAKALPHQIAFNCIPHIGRFQEDGSTSEESKIIAETKKMLELPQLRISATSVRVPTFSCHALSVNVECLRSVEVGEFRSFLKSQAGIVVQDEPEKNVYPLGVTAGGDLVESATGKDPVYVGRIRQDFSVDHGVSFWVVSDNLRKGAALNAVQIGEILLKSLR